MTIYKKEITFELTNYCSTKPICKYCSSNATSDYNSAQFITIEKIKEKLSGHFFKKIVLSGGEPLAHPNFFKIYMLCKNYTNDILVYSNLITHRVYNANVIDGVYLEANLTLLPEVDKIHILRRVKQGKEKNRPEVHLSRNYKMDCSCNHRVIIPTGEETLTPCNKSIIKFKQNIYHNKYYICGAHGVGKSTILLEINNKLKINIYENSTTNPYTQDVFKRQLWRLMKYITDDEIIRTNNNLSFTNRCCVDWLIYTKTFRDLGWLNDEQYNILLKKYDNYFKNKIPKNIIYINPEIKWSKKRIKERWINQSIKFREEDFNYYTKLRENYDIIFENISNIENIVEIKDIDRTNRIEQIENIILN